MDQPLNLPVSQVIQSTSKTVDEPKRKSREDWRKAKKLGEMRKANIFDQSTGQGRKFLSGAEGSVEQSASDDYFAYNCAEVADAATPNLQMLTSKSDAHSGKRKVGTQTVACSQCSGEKRLSSAKRIVQQLPAGRGIKFFPRAEESVEHTPGDNKAARQFTNVVDAATPSLQMSISESDAHNAKREVGIQTLDSYRCSTGNLHILHPSDNVLRQDRQSRNVYNLCHLILLYHAKECKDSNTCHAQTCRKFKELQLHLNNCADQQCTSRNCLPTKQLMAHIKDCRNSCDFCFHYTHFIKGSYVEKCHPQHCTQYCRYCSVVHNHLDRKHGKQKKPY